MAKMQSFPAIFLFIVIGGYFCFIGLQTCMKTRDDVTVPQIALQYHPTKVALMKKNWTADCSFPSYIPEAVQAEPWFPLYLSHLQRVSLSQVSKKRRHVGCSRWWYPTPQLIRGEYPSRKIGWKLSVPAKNYVRPNCTFGQEKVETTRCAKAHGELWRTLDKMGIIYFPRSGSELGVVRGSKYLSSDGDVDVFVDMPQEQLLPELKKRLTTSKPYLSGKMSKINAEVHWKVKSCANVHMVFGDWITDDMVNLYGRPTHAHMCTCYMNSVPLSCHKEGLKRVYAQYGPSWRVPLHAKALDVPYYARGYNIVKKLKRMLSGDRIIHEKTVRALDPRIEYADEEMKLILAQLNVLKALIDYQKSTKDYTWV